MEASFSGMSDSFSLKHHNEQSFERNKAELIRRMILPHATCKINSRVNYRYKYER